MDEKVIVLQTQKLFHPRFEGFQKQKLLVLHQIPSYH